MLTRLNVILDAALFERQLFTTSLTKQLSRFHSKRLLRIFIHLCWGFTVFGLLCEFVLFTLFFPTTGRFLAIFLLRDKSDGVGAFSTLSNETAEDVDNDCELLAPSRLALLLVELDEELGTISDSCDDSHQS